METKKVLKLPNCKNFFIPEKGKVFFNVDYSGADAMIVAYESDCIWLQKFFKTSKIKLYQYIGQEYLQRELPINDPMYKKFKQFIHLCLTGDHEVLTETGWKRLDKYIEDRVKVPIAVVCAESESKDITYEIPKDFHKYTVKEDLIELSGKVNLLGTKNHRQPVLNHKKEVEVLTLEELKSSGRFLQLTQAGNTRNINRESFTYIKLLVAIQAHGKWDEIQYKYSKKIHLKILTKNKKVYYLKTLLEHLEIDYKETIIKSRGTLVKTYSSIEIIKREIVNRLYKDLGKTNTFPVRLLKLRKDLLTCFVDELGNWDGIKGEKGDIYYSANKKNMDLVQGIAALCNRRFTYKEIKGRTNALYYSGYICKNTNPLNRYIKKKLVPFQGKVYCITTSTGYFLVRYKGTVSITGNSNYGGKADKAGKAVGMPTKDARNLQRVYFKLCPEIPTWHKNIEYRVNTVKYLENIFGARGYFTDVNDPTLLNKAYSWLPQSTIGIAVNKALVTLYIENKNLPKKNKIEVLLQTHDSLSGQYEKEDVGAKNRIIKAMSIELPYKRPLIIPVDIGISEKSYGDCD